MLDTDQRHEFDTGQRHDSILTKDMFACMLAVKAWVLRDACIHIYPKTCIMIQTFMHGADTCMHDADFTPASAPAS